MPSKEWSPVIAGKEYSVLVEHGTILRRYKIYLNGHLIEPLENILIEKGNRLSFKIDDHMVTVIIRFSGFSEFDYDLVVDDISIETLTIVELPPELILEKKGCFGEIKDTIWGAIIFGLLSLSWGLVRIIYDSLGQYKSIPIALLFILLIFLFWKRLFKKK